MFSTISNSCGAKVALTNSAYNLASKVASLKVGDILYQSFLRINLLLAVLFFDRIRFMAKFGLGCCRFHSFVRISFIFRTVRTLICIFIAGKILKQNQAGKAWSMKTKILYFCSIHLDLRQVFFKVDRFPIYIYFLIFFFSVLFFVLRS